MTVARELLVVRLIERVNRVLETQDASPVLEASALWEAETLLASITPEPIDVEALMAIGMLHWARHHALSGADERHARMLGLRCFAAIFPVNPDAVPDDVGSAFKEHGVQAVFLDTGIDVAFNALREAEATTSTEALDEALAIVAEVLPMTPDGHPRRVAGLTLIAAAHRMRFEWAGRPADLDVAIAAAEDAADSMAADDPNLAEPLALVSGLLRARFELARAPSDLTRAVGVARNALRCTSADDPNLASHLAYLAQALHTSNDMSGDPAELEEALSVARRAVDARASDDEAHARHLSTLAGVLRARFETTGALGDIDEAVEAAQAAVDLSTGPHRTIYLTLLAAALQTRFGRGQDRADLDAAIAVMREAMDLLPPEHPARPRHLATLTSALRTRAENPILPGAELGDLVEAVDRGREAVAAAESEYDRAVATINLATALRALYRLSGQAELLDEAIDLSRAALTHIGTEHLGRAAIQVNLAMMLRQRHESSRDEADLHEAIEHARDVAARMSASPMVRAIAARGWGAAAAAMSDWPVAIEGYETAIDVLPLVAPHGAIRADQEHGVAELAGLGADAAACCVRAGRLEHALELVEAGRGVLIGQALDVQTDLAALDATAPEQAARFRSLRSALEIPDLAGEAEGRRRLGAELVQLIGRIRTLPGFERFVEPPSAAELVGAASDGPVVVVNISGFGSDALLITPAGVDAVPLPAATPEAVRDRIVELLAALEAVRGGDREAEAALTGILAWTWDAIAGPVLDALGIAAGDAPPRLWWCPTGPLALLPLHAAGYHDTRADAVPRTVLDRVVSAYTPTLRALVHARRPPTRTTRAPAGTPLVVSMPKTPGATDLPGAAAEADALGELLGDRHRTLDGPRATFERVAAALPSAAWAHFACHAASDAASPSDSRLLLHDHQIRPLTVLELARMRIEDADLAFLSACATARTDWRHADEAIHLAAGCQLAGYRHVIATLWPISDRAAVRIATSLYARLVEERAADNAAVALAAAVRDERERSVDRPSLWAAYVGYGR